MVSTVALVCFPDEFIGMATRFRPLDEFKGDILKV
jgi:hypothetical protein